MISSEGKFRNGKKFTELAYLLPISRNSGVLKRMASRECIGIPLIRPTATESMRRMVGPQFSDLLQAGHLWVVGFFLKAAGGTRVQGLISLALLISLFHLNSISHHLSWL